MRRPDVGHRVEPAHRVVGAPRRLQRRVRPAGLRQHDPIRGACCMVTGASKLQPSHDFPIRRRNVPLASDCPGNPAASSKISSFAKPLRLAHVVVARVDPHAGSGGRGRRHELPTVHPGRAVLDTEERVGRDLGVRVVIREARRGLRAEDAPTNKALERRRKVDRMVVGSGPGSSDASDVTPAWRAACALSAQPRRPCEQTGPSPNLAQSSTACYGAPTPAPRRRANTAPPSARSGRSPRGTTPAQAAAGSPRRSRSARCSPLPPACCSCGCGSNSEADARGADLRRADLDLEHVVQARRGPKKSR